MQEFVLISDINSTDLLTIVVVQLFPRNLKIAEMPDTETL